MTENEKSEQSRKKSIFSCCKGGENKSTDILLINDHPTFNPSVVTGEDSNVNLNMTNNSSSNGFDSTTDLQVTRSTIERSTAKEVYITKSDSLKM